MSVSFSYQRDCIEHSLQTSSKCPLCKSAVSKRSLTNNNEILKLVRLYERLLDAYKKDTGIPFEDHLIRQWESNPDPNLSQNHPHPEKSEVHLKLVEKKIKAELDEIDKKLDDPFLDDLSPPVLKIDDSLPILDCPSPPLIEDIDFVIGLSVDKNRQDLNLKYCSILGAITTEEIEKATHLVTSVNENGEAQRKIKYCMALLSNIWILSEKWLSDSIKAKRFLPEADYEIQGDKFGLGAPRKSRLSKSKLFSGMNFFLYGKFTSPSEEIVKQLLKAGGGIIIPNLSDLKEMTDTESIVLCDKMQNDFQTGSAVIKRFPILTTNWIFDCISNFDIEQYDHYSAL